MPSIPQSLLWISLVVLWLFVLVPMLINKRDTVRRTSDVALATRVLNSNGTRSRLFKRRGPGAGHRHDPDWQHDEDEVIGEFVEDYPDLDDEYAEQRDVIREYDDAVREARMGGRVRSVVVVAAVSERTVAESEYLDVDIVDENSGALPVGGAGVQASLFDPPQEKAPKEVPEPVTGEAAEPAPAPEPEPRPEPLAEPVAENAPEPAAEPVSDEYEYIDDTSEFEAEVETPVRPAAARSASRQRRLETTAAAAVSARKYRFRKRVLTAMVFLMVLTAVLSFTVSSTLWWSCGAIAGVLVLYLGYLRRQTRIEEQVRRRRQQRMARSRGFAETAPPPRMPEVDLDEFPTRLQRPGAVVLEIDDEDPVFDHLEEMAYSGTGYGPHGDLPRASGQ